MRAVGFVALLTGAKQIWLDRKFSPLLRGLSYVPLRPSPAWSHWRP